MSAFFHNQFGEKKNKQQRVLFLFSQLCLLLVFLLAIRTALSGRRSSAREKGNKPFFLSFFLSLLPIPIDRYQ
jgi:hypothetical protein